MTEQEPKSECCGAEVADDILTRSLITIARGKDPLNDNPFYCLKCYKPCSIAKLPKASKVKEAIDAKE